MLTGGAERLGGMALLLLAEEAEVAELELLLLLSLSVEESLLLNKGPVGVWKEEGEVVVEEEGVVEPELVAACGVGEECVLLVLAGCPR